MTAVKMTSLIVDGTETNNDHESLIDASSLRAGSGSNRNDSATSRNGLHPYA